MNIKNIIFDFGGVLVDWNPRYLYKNHFEHDDEMEFFLKNICTDDWNLEQDKGRSLQEGTKLLQEQYPEYHTHIGNYYGQWESMLKSDIPGTVLLLQKLKSKYKIYGLTNWSAETITVAYQRFSFFKEFDGIVVSGDEKMIKPNYKIYETLLNRYHLKAEDSIFIDDNLNNIKAAKELGIQAIHFTSPNQLEQCLLDMKIL